MESRSAGAWRRVEESELGLPGVSAGTGFGRSEGLRVSGKIYAIYGSPDLVLKLPRTRVEELIDSGEGLAWGPGNGRIMKEWARIPSAEADRWPELVAEAREFVGL